MPTALTILYCDEDDVKHILSITGEQARLDDQPDGVVDTYEQVAFVQAQSYATTKVDLYCQPLYDGEDLVKSWLVKEWAAIIAAHWLCTRRGNTPPNSLRDMIFGTTGRNIGVMGEMNDVRSGVAQIPSISQRNPSWPSWSNVRVDCNYRLRQIRVERPISERSPTQYSQNVDWFSECCFEI